MTTPRAARAAAEITRMQAFFPVMRLLGNELAARRPFAGHTIGVSAHLTTITAALIQELTLGGGQWAVCGASEATTDPGVVDLLRSTGVAVYTAASREDHHLQVLDHGTTLLADAGGDLVEEFPVVLFHPGERNDGAAGAEGYPNLLDDDWLWGGSMVEIADTVRYGVRNTTDAWRGTACSSARSPNARCSTLCDW